MEKSTGRKILNIVGIVVASILTLVFIAQIVLAVMVKNDPESVSDLPFTIFYVISDSMYPTFSTNDGIIEVNTDFGDLKVGDIITAYQDGEFVTHRIVEKSDATVTTQGDANYYTDTPITASAYVGKVVLILPGFSSFLKASEGWRKVIWIAVIVFVLFAPEAIFRISENMRKKRRIAS